MVVFSCDACGDSLRKKDVLKHYQFNCRKCESLTCVDCKKQFWGDEYVAHTQCITDEDFKYGLVSQHKDDKGQVKQNQWRSHIGALLSDRSTDKRWTPILLEMQNYENVPRKKKPFMNWCKCTMKRFPFKVVEEIFDKLLEMHAKIQKGTTTSEQKNGEERMDADGSNLENEVAEDTDGLQKKFLNKKKHTNGQVEPIGNGTTKERSKKRKAENEDEEMDQTETAEELPKKKKKKLNQAEAPSKGVPEAEKDSERTAKEDKFKLKKCVVQVLLAKGEPMKSKRVLKKVLAAYGEFLEAHEASGSKRVKAWTETEVSAKLEKLLEKNKAFKNCNGVVQLSEAGKAKYVSEHGETVVSD